MIQLLTLPQTYYLICYVWSLSLLWIWITCWPCLCWIPSQITVCLIHLTSSFSFSELFENGTTPYYSNFLAVVRLIIPHFNSVTCYPNHFPFIQLLLLLTVDTVLATDLTSSSNQPWFHKMSAMQLWDKGQGSFRTTPPHPSRHTTDDQTAFGCLPPIGWIPLLSSGDYKMLHTPFKPFNCWNQALVQSNSLPLFATN